MRAFKLREIQDNTGKPIDKNEIDTDYSEKPDGIPMSDTLRNVVNLVQLENDIQIKEVSKQSDMI